MTNKHQQPHRFADLMKLAANDASLRFQYYRFGEWVDCATDVNWSIDYPMRLREEPAKEHPHKEVLLRLADDPTLMIQSRNSMTGEWEDMQTHHLVPFGQYRIKPVVATVGQYMMYRDKDEIFYVLVDMVADEYAFYGIVAIHNVLTTMSNCGYRVGDHTIFSTKNFTPVDNPFLVRKVK